MAGRRQLSPSFQVDAGRVTHSSPWIGLSASFEEQRQHDSQRQHKQEKGAEDPELELLKAAWNMPTTRRPTQPAPRIYEPTPSSILRAFDVARELTPAEAANIAPDEPSMYIWRCQECPPEESVCCRIGDGRRCLCGHKSKDHKRLGRCIACNCKAFRFHVQFPGFELRCRCKHKHTDHVPIRGRKASQAMRCIKCDCGDFHSSWTCHCGHGWSSHVTVPYRGLLGPRAREWVVSGVSKEVVAEAARKREQWARTGKLPFGASETAAAMALAAAAERYRRSKAHTWSPDDHSRRISSIVIAPEALEEARIVLGLPGRNGSASVDHEIELIRRAFKRRSLETHPDKGGSAEHFQRVKDAHDVLVAAAASNQR